MNIKNYFVMNNSDDFMLSDDSIEWCEIDFSDSEWN